MEEKNTNYFGVLGGVVIILLLIGFFAFNFYRKSLSPKYEIPEDKMVVSESTDTATSDTEINSICDKTKTLKESTYTVSQVKSAIFEDDNCTLTLTTGTNLSYPSKWSVGFFYTYWPEFDFYYPIYDSSKAPDMTIIDMGVVFVDSLEKSLLTHLDSLDSLSKTSNTEAVITPLMFKEDIDSTDRTELGKYDALRIISKKDKTTLNYIFKDSRVNKIWLLKVKDSSYFSQNIKDIVAIVDSINSN